MKLDGRLHVPAALKWAKSHRYQLYRRVDRPHILYSHGAPDGYCDRLCGLLATDPEVPGSISGATTFLEK
jgi:hypothetical protein